MAHVILYSNLNLHGDHRHIVADEPSLVAANFNDQMQSFVILEGVWQFFQDIDFQTPFPGFFGPGAYTYADLQGVTGRALSSLRPSTQAPTIHGDGVPAVVTLFEHESFHGDHRHVFLETSDFTAGDFPPFNDMASSLAIQRVGAVRAPDVQFCSDINYGRPYFTVLQSGIYPSMAAYGLPNDDVSSLKFVNGLPGQIPQGLQLKVGDMAFGDLILFEDENFRGRHRHVYQEEPDLGAADDAGFLKLASSMWIGFGAWSFYTQANFQGLMPAWSETAGTGNTPTQRTFFTPGVYPSFTRAGLRNDALSSLRLLTVELHAPPDDAGQSTALGWAIAFVGLHETSALHITQNGQDITASMQLYQTINDVAGQPWGYAYFMRFQSARGIHQEFTITCPIEGPFIASTKMATLNWVAPPIPQPTPQKVIVPNIVGLQENKAAQTLQAVHLGLGNVYNFSAVTDPTQLKIAGQQPAAGSSVNTGSLVDVGVVPATPTGTPAGANLVHCVNNDDDTVHVWISSGTSWRDLGAVVSGGTLDVTTPSNQTVLLEAFPVNISPSTSTQYLVAVTVAPNSGPHQLIIP